MKLLSGGIGLSRLAGVGVVTVLLAGAFGACGGDDEVPITPSTSGGRAGMGGNAGSAMTGGRGGVGGGTGGSTAGSGGKGSGGATGGTTGGGSGGTSGGGRGGAGAGGTPDGGGSSGAAGMVDAGDSGRPDGDASGEAEAAAPIKIEEYLRQIDLAWCYAVERCCNLAGRFDINKCVNVTDSNFGADNLGAYLGQYGNNFTGANIVLDQTSARDCISQQFNRTCGSEGGDIRRSRYAICMTAVQGTLTEGKTGCKTSAECTAGLFCQRVGDAGTGTCTAVASVNGACADPNYNSDQCTYLGTMSATSLHCTGWGTTGTCVAGKANAVICNNDQECASSVCSTQNGACVASEAMFPSTFLCNLFTIPSDGGGG